MKELKLLETIFGSNTLWKNRYKIDWCDLCNTFVLICPTCSNTTCNCGGCDECIEDFKEFSKNVKHRIESYLSTEEIQIYRKIQRLKTLIYESIKSGENEINWEKLCDEGKLSRRDESLFLKTI